MASTRSGLQGVPIYGTSEILFPIQILGVDLCSCSVRSTEWLSAFFIISHRVKNHRRQAGFTRYPIGDYVINPINID